MCARKGTEGSNPSLSAACSITTLPRVTSRLENAAGASHFRGEVLTRRARAAVGTGARRVAEARAALVEPPRRVVEARAALVEPPRRVVEARAALVEPPRRVAEAR